MNRHPAAAGIPGFTLLAMFVMAAVPVMGMAADDAQAERESRRIEGEARRQQEIARTEMAARERAQAEALQGQEDAMRRMEATRARIEANTQQIAQQSVEQSRAYGNSYPYPYPYPSSLPEAPLVLPITPVAPAVSVQMPRAAYDDPVGGIILAPLTTGLGRYFGVEQGVLVVRAGASPFGLQDGDVILAIDGRVPVDEQHAAGILRSYRSGERLKLRVQRDRKVVTLDATAPNRREN